MSETSNPQASGPAPAGSGSEEIVGLLEAAARGSDEAVDQLLPKVYDELRCLASSYLHRERCDHTLQPTALVHEAYLRLIGQRTVGWRDRAQFFYAAATVMRRILVDHARARNAIKRGGNWRKTALDDAVTMLEERAVDLVSLDEALVRLAELDERMSRIVELRFFGGLTVEETSGVMEMSVRTVEREWTMAKAWLRGELNRTDDAGGARR